MSESLVLMVVSVGATVYIAVVLTEIAFRIWRWRQEREIKRTDNRRDQ
jgi:hypothetical protein